MSARLETGTRGRPSPSASENRILGNPKKALKNEKYHSRGNARGPSFASTDGDARPRIPAWAEVDPYAPAKLEE